MKSLALFSRRAVWPRRPFKLGRPATHCLEAAHSIYRYGEPSTSGPTAVIGKLCRVKGLSCADVTTGSVLSVVDYAPENALRAHLPVLRIPRIRAFRRLAGESANIFTASTERHGAWRWSVEAEFPASFAKLQLLGASGSALGILFSPEDTEMSVGHLVGSFTWVQQERVVLVTTRSVHSLRTMTAFDPACYFRNAAVEVILSD